jgi:glycosyltransferase involved in cell wall biosynthesis
MNGVDVALIGSYPPPHGGQSVHIANMAAYLRTEGLTTQVLNTSSNKTVQAEGVINIRNTRALLTRLLKGPRIRLIHVHVATLQELGKLVPAIAAAAVRRSIVVVTVHSGNSAAQLASSPLFQRTLAKRLLASANAVIFVNETLKREMTSAIQLRNVAVIPAFSIDFQRGSLPADVARFMRAHTPTLTCAGLFEPTYGFDQAVLLLKRLREIQPNAGLVLMGDPRGAEECRQQIADLGLEQHVALCGNLDHAQCLEVMRESTVFLRPTRFDGDALSVREALALGVPVIASTTDFRPDGCVLYRNGDFDDLVTKTESTLGTQHGPRRPANDRANLDAVLKVYREVLNPSQTMRRTFVTTVFLSLIRILSVLVQMCGDLIDR